MYSRKTFRGYLAVGGSWTIEQDNLDILWRWRFSVDSPGGRNLHFGIREHADGRYCERTFFVKLRAFGASFFISATTPAPIRLAALMELPTILIFTHDALGDGEDGPTHQPVEQLSPCVRYPG